MRIEFPEGVFRGRWGVKSLVRPLCSVVTWVTMGRAQRRKLEQRAQRQANRNHVRVWLPDGTAVEPVKRARPRGVDRDLDGFASTALPGPLDGWEPPEGPAAPQGAGPSTDPAVRLSEVREAVAHRAAVEREIARAVAAARGAGASWRAVGAALGVSHVAALKRYGGGIEGAASGGAAKRGRG